MQLDLATLTFINIVNLLAMAAALPIVMGRDQSPAALQVRTSLMVKAAAWVLLALTPRWAGQWPDQVLATLALALMGLSHVLIFRALGLWLGPRPLGRLLVVLAVATPIGFALSFHNFPVRVVWVSLMLVGQLLIQARATLRPAPDKNNGRGWRYLLFACLMLMALLLSARAALGALRPPLSPDFHTPSPMLLLTLVATSVTLVLGNIALLAAWREEAQQQLRTLAITDALTGLLNRAGWARQADAALRHAQRHGHSLSVLMIDLDHFKRINDSQGHQAGDAVLKFFGQVLQRCQRAGDVIARLGGEEFCVLLNQGDPLAAPAFDRRLREAMAETAPAALPAGLDFSAGHARRQDGDTLETLMARADAALYQAKHAGRGRLVSADAPPAAA